MNDNEFALLLTWTCYGTWLPGDRRGYVANTLHPDGTFATKQNTPRTPYTADDAYARSRARTVQEYPTVRLTSEKAVCIVESMIEAARERDWSLLRGAVMPNHVHVVVMNCTDDGPTVRRVLKGTSQAALSRQHGSPKRWWTAGGSDRYLHDEQSILAAMRYVENQRGMLAFIVEGVVIRTT